MPGYCAGSGFFFRNVNGLASKARVFLVDWLGTGELLNHLYVSTWAHAPSQVLDVLHKSMEGRNAIVHLSSLTSRTHEAKIINKN